MHKQTKIFSHKVADVMQHPVTCATPGQTCGSVIAAMMEDRASCCAVLDGFGKLAGVLKTIGILNRIVFQVDADTPIEDVMDRSVQTIYGDEYLYHAIARMRRLNLHELIVVDRSMRPIGVVHLQGAMALAADDKMKQIDQISVEGRQNRLEDVKAAQVDLARDMFDDHQPASVVQQFLSHVNNEIYAQILEKLIAQLEAEGWGPPPVEFCALVMGSGGRGENYLYPDQDNGFILEDYPDDQHNLVDPYFRELSDRFCRQLDEVGFPYCRGNVMATNPVWRKSLSQWKEQVSLWGRKRNSVALRLADIFFDFQPVWGKLSLAKDLRTHVMKAIKSNHFFLQEMFATQIDRGAALSLFGRFATEEQGDEAGMLDLKYRGSLPLVEAIRLLSLKHGFEETSTLERMSRLHQEGHLSDGEFDYLSSACSFLTQVLLKRQVDEFHSGEPVTRFIDPDSLNARERETLMSAFRHIEAFRKRLKGEFTGDVF